MLNTFSTGQQQFDKDYEVNALLQKGFNVQILDDLREYVLRVMPYSTTQAINILDLCCGDGGITKVLLQKFEEKNIKINKIVGYDISAKQISEAQKYTQENDKLTFVEKGILQMTDHVEYDLVISLFGLHWVENINLAAEKIHQALKPEGKLMYFVPLEKMKFFELRKSLISSDTFRKQFENYCFSPFIDKPETYFAAFSSFFKSENPEGLCGGQLVEFTIQKFKQFLSSWMQELRHLDHAAPEHKQIYLNALVDCIPHLNGICHDVERAENKEILFHERFFWYHGVKKEEAWGSLSFNQHG